MVMKAYTRHLLFCTGSDCKGKSLMKEARKLLGKDAVRVKRSPVKCLGACKLGPVMIVYPDGVWYRCENKKTLREIIERHVLGGEIVEAYVLYRMGQPQPLAAAGD
jgi:(2Fe-2S) ferredoxin